MLSKYCMLLCFLCIQQQSKAQTADLIIQKTGPTSVAYGGLMSYSIKISNNGPTAVNNAIFNDTLPYGVMNVSVASCIANGGATCPSSNSYSLNSIYHFGKYYTLFTGSIPTLPVNSSITFTITLNATTDINLSSFSNSAHVIAPSNINDPDLTTNSSTWNTAIYKGNVDIAVSNQVDDNKGYACINLPKSYNYTVRWINKGPINVSNVILYDNIIAEDVVITGTGVNFMYPMTITNVNWKASSGTIISINSFNNTFNANFTYNGSLNLRNIQANANYFEKGDTITLTYTLNIQTPNTTCSGNISWNLVNYASHNSLNSSAKDINPLNDTSTVKSGKMTCTANNTRPNVDVKVIKTVDNKNGYPSDSLPKRYKFTVKWINQSQFPINAFELFDQMNVTNLFVRGQGNSLFEYAWSIIDVSWYSSPSTQTPTGGFQSSNGKIQLPDGYPVFPPCKKTIPIFYAGDTITLTYTFVLEKPIIRGCGRAIQFGISNFASYSANCIRDINQRNDSMTVSIGLFYASSNPCDNIDLKVTKTVSDNKGYTCDKLPKSYDYTIKWINKNNQIVDSILITDYMSMYTYSTSGNGNARYNYNWNISNISWSSNYGSLNSTPLFLKVSGNTSPPNSSNEYLIKSVINNFKAKDTIILKYTLTIEPPSVTGCGRALTWAIENRASIIIQDSSKNFDTIPDNNYAYTTVSDFNVNSTDLVVSTSVNPVIVDDGDTLTMSNEFYNASGSVASPAIWLDTLPETFNINLSSIRCTRITGSSSCGRITYDSVTRVLKQEITSMPANSGVKVTFSGTVNSLYTVTEYNKANAYYSCLDCVPATNFTQSNYQINGECDSVFAGVDGDTAVYDNYTDTIFLFKLLKGKPQLGGTWFQLSGTGGIFNAAAGTFIVKPRTTTSTFMYVLPANAPCPADTSIVTITILEQPTPDTIIKTIPINTTTTICDFLPNNISDVTVAACNNSTSVNWNINSQTKCVEYNSSNIKGNDTICVSVCNTQTQVCKETNIIITINGVPPHANDDTLIETSINTPVTISVLTNDITPDNDSLALCNPPLFTQPIHGNVEINQNGTITYIPALGYIGKDSFQYIICDAEGNDTAWVRIAIKCDVNDTCCDIPNAFSPNGDGINDIFRIRCSCVLEEFYLIIYNRWGNKVFESRDVNIGWDGKYKNKIDQVEAYGYYLEYRSACGTKKVTKKGNVTLIE